MVVSRSTSLFKLVIWDSRAKCYVIENSVNLLVPKVQTGNVVSGQAAKYRSSMHEGAGALQLSFKKPTRRRRHDLTKMEFSVDTPKPAKDAGREPRANAVSRTSGEG